MIVRAGEGGGEKRVVTSGRRNLFENMFYQEVCKIDFHGKLSNMGPIQT